MNFTMSVGEKSRKAKRKMIDVGKSFKIICFWIDFFFFLDNNFIEIQLKYHIVYPLEV